MSKFKVAASLAACGMLAAGARLAAQQGEGKVQTVSREDGAASRSAKAPQPIDPAIRRLIEARVAVAGGIYRDEMARLEHTNKMPDEELPGWSRRWMEDQIKLGPDPAGLLAAIQAHLERMRRLEEVTENYARSGQAPSGSPAKAKYFRLEAEQMLAEARAAHPELPLPGS